MSSTDHLPGTKTPIRVSERVNCFGFRSCWHIRAAVLQIMQALQCECLDLMSVVPLQADCGCWQVLMHQDLMFYQPGLLTSSCRQTVARWQKALKGVPWLTAIDNLQPEKSAVSEELNVAWARHEIISDNVNEVTCCPLPKALSHEHRDQVLCMYQFSAEAS